MKLWPVLLVVFLLVGLVFVSGCAKKTEENTTANVTPPVQNVTPPMNQTPVAPIPAEENNITAPTFDDTDTDFGDLI
jgi:PBP1b-binding outer membrane lipoprotein LpoB